MSVEYIPTLREKQALMRLWHEIRDAAFTARCVPSHDVGIKDHTRHIEFMLILLEDSLASIYQDLWKDLKDDHTPWKAP